jgi:hypothetical protein
MTELTKTQSSRMKELHSQLAYKGITPTEWDELIPIRKIYLESKGKDPSKWNLDSRNLSKKM